MLPKFNLLYQILTHNVTTQIDVIYNIKKYFVVVKAKNIYVK